MKSKIVALSKNEEFKGLLNKKKISNKYVTIFFGELINKDNKKLNISFVTKKKIGNAVRRNKIKRRLKSIMNDAVKKISINKSKILLMGFTFKENCSDLRNSKVADLVKDLQDVGCEVYVHDPLADPKQAQLEYGVKLRDWDQLPNNADAIVAAVSHDGYTNQPVANLLAPLKSKGVFIDIKASYSPEAITNAGVTLWRL